MRFPLRRLRIDKRGVSGVVSGLFILVIAIAIVGFIYETYQAQTKMSDWDAARVRERTEVTNVFFGGTNQYSPNSVTPANSPIANLEKLDNSYLQFNSSKADQVITPISNMNFSSGDTGWSFGRDPGSRDVEGAHSYGLGNPPPGSGLGSIYVQMTGVATGPYWMNWTYFFSYSQGLPTTTYFSWAKMVWDTRLASSAAAYVVLASPSGTLTVIRGPIDLLSLGLQSWYYESIELGSGIISSPGTYALTIAVNSATADTGNPHDSSNVVVFFDDVGISTVLGEICSTDFYGTCNTGKDPSDLRRLQVYYAGHYNPFSGTLSYSPTSLTTLGNTSNIGGSYQNLAVKDGNLISFRSYTTNTPNGYNPSSYSLLGQTTLQAGTIGNLASDDGTYQSFGSYHNFNDVHQFTDNAISNVDSSSSLGTHSNFTAQQYGPDSIYDDLTEVDTGGSASFGSSSGTSFTIVSANYMYGSVFTSPADAGGATLQNITWYGRGNSGSGNAKAVLVLHSTLAIVAVSDAVSFTTTQAERTCIFSSPPTISAGTNYILMMVFSVSTRFYYGVGSMNQGHLDTSNSYTTPTDPTDATHNNNQYRISAAYNRANNYELDLEAQWTNVDYSETHEELAIYARRGNTYALDATGGYMILGGNPNWGSVTGTISFWIKCDAVAGRPWGQDENMETRFSGTTLVIDWGAAGSLTSTTSFTTGKWYFIAIVWNENTNQLILYIGDENNAPTQDAISNSWYGTVSTVGVTQNNFMASKGGVEPLNGRGDELRYWNTARSLANIQSDYNTQLTGSEANLRSYFKLNNNFDDMGPDDCDGSGSGSYSFSTDAPFSGSTETIQVDVWNGGSWQNVFTDLADGWNNVSVSSYLISQNFTIRYKGGAETSDTTQNSWQIDAALLHIWTDENVVEVELSGLSNTSNWESLNWTINSAWTVSGVSVTIQLFNYSMAQYPTSGNGYISYTSVAPNTDETYSQAISSAPSNFRNATGNWRIKIRGVKETPTQFSFLCDWVEFAPSSCYYTVDWYGEFTIADVAVINQTDISYWGYFNTSTIAQTMYIYNWNTSTYDQIGTSETYSTAGVGQWHNRTINLNSTNYLTSSRVRIRIFSGSNSSGSFESFADFCNIGILGTTRITTTAQKLYVMDYANNQWHLLVTSEISTNDEMIGPIEIIENVSNYADAQGTILVRVFSESETLVNCQANFIMIRLYFADMSKITLEVVNLGSETVNLARIWVDNSTGHSKIDLLMGVNIDRAIISPGEQATIQIDYPYSICQYTFKVLTKRGTIAAYVKTAS